MFKVFCFCFRANQHSSLEQQGSPNGNSPPLRPFIPPYMDAYPLRKTGICGAVFSYSNGLTRLSSNFTLAEY